MTLFEKIIARQIPADIVYEDEACLAFRDISPQAPVHVLIVPKKPIPRVGEATAEDQAQLGALLLAAGAVAEKLGVRSTEKGFRLAINHGRDAGETVPHLHVHLLAGRELAWPPG
jgi:histidine triad (HIT) family protein